MFKNFEEKYNSLLKEFAEKQANNYNKNSKQSSLNISALTEKKEKTGDVTPDGESTLRVGRNSTKVWRNKQGLFHRLEGPAIEGTDGHKQWWINGKLHRLDGPAIEYAGGIKFWYIDGIEFSYEDWKKELEHRKKLADTHAKGSKDSGLNISALTEQEEKKGDVSPDGESTLMIGSGGNKYWYNKQRQFHRRDGPAAEWTDGHKEWWINDKLHRLDGPAIEYANGNKAWFIDGIKYSYEDWKKEIEHRKNLADIHKKGSEDSGLNIGALNETFPVEVQEKKGARCTKVTGQQASSRSDKKYMRCARVDGKLKRVHYGDPNLRIKKSNPKRRKSFRARHKCSSAKPGTAKYFSCKNW